MNFTSQLSSKRNSVNSSLATVKASNQTREINQTINKNREKSKIRFSHQETIQVPKMLQRNSQYKESQQLQRENYMLYSCQDLKPCCFNHQAKEASHIVLQNSGNPLHYCERCAILIASKGFNINPIHIQKGKENILKKRNESTQLELQLRDQLSKLNWPKNDSQKNNHTREVCKNQDKNLTNNLNLCHFAQNKVYLSSKVISNLQNCWRVLKVKRQQSLNQVDICINNLNESIDSLQDYFYTLHEYIQKQKNHQVKEILVKKQILEQLRSETNEYFIKQFTSVKDLKQKLVKFGNCQSQHYQKILEHRKYHDFSIDSEKILQEFKAYNKTRLSNVHQIGEQIVQTIRYFSGTVKDNSSQIKKEAHVNHENYSLDHRPFSCIKNERHLNRKSFSRNSQSMRQNSSLIKLRTLNITESNEYSQNEGVGQKGHIQGVRNVESSIRSLQLSFDNSQEESDQGRQVCTNNQSNNFTLNQYINNRVQESYTNLLLTSTEI